MSEREPDPKPIEIFFEETDGQLSIEPVEDEELSLGEWTEKMPRGEQYRTLGLARRPASEPGS